MSDITLYLDSAVRVTGKIHLLTDPQTGEVLPFVLQRVGKAYGNIP